MATGSGQDARSKPVRDGFGLVGTTVAQKYQVESVIGEGGYGIVYAARHLLIGKPIALKCMKPLGTSAEDGARATGLFLREAQVLFSMSHPGIVRLYDVGTLTVGLHDEVPYAVLELVDGRSLEQEIDGRAVENRPFSRVELERIFIGTLEALAFTHAAGIAHRDLKPSNIMLVAAPDGFRPKVLDFGVARFVARDTKHSTGLTGFTPAYAAPEQWTDGFGEPGPATDVFSLALTFAEAITLRTVLEARTPAQIFGVVMAKGRKVDLAGRLDLPSSLQVVLDRALEVEPTLRYPSATEMLADIRSAFATDTVSTPPLRPPPAVTQAAPFEGEPGPDPNLATAPSTLRLPPHQGTSVPPRDMYPSQAPPIAVAPLPPALPPPRGGAPWSIVVVAAVVAVGSIGAALFVARGKHAAAVPAAPATPLASAPREASPPRKIHVTAVATGAGSQYAPEQLLAAVSAVNDDLARCHRAAVADGSPAVADVSLFVTIHPTGFVMNVLDLDEIDPLAKKLDRWTHLCVGGIASAWRFPSNDKDDLSGAVIKVRLREGAPDTTALPEPTLEKYDALWLKEKPKETYPAYKVTARVSGRILTLDYKDGVGVCVEYNNKLGCRWVQLDSNGRTTLERKPSGTLEGRWGFGEDDSSQGTLRLTPAGATPEPKPKAKAKPKP